MTTTSTTMSTSQRSSAMTGFVLGSLATVVTAVVVQKLQKSLSEKKRSSSMSTSSEKQGDNKTNSNTRNSNSSSHKHIPAELRQEQLSRHTLYFGQDGMAKLKSARVCIVGLGGVGSHTAHMLARAGVGYLKLIDFDQVTLSSLNRHACATLQDVGIPKVTCLQRFLEQICPDPEYLQIESVVEMYTAASGERLLECNGNEKWDMVIDAIDDVPTKAALLAHCLNNKIRVLSCMGAGGKSDVTRLHISDLKTAAKDPLASKLRQHLKKLMPANSDNYLEDMEALSVVYSSEKTVVKLADFTPEQKLAGVHQYGAVDGMRIRVIPVLGTMPAVMGQTLAAKCLTDLGDMPFQPVTGERVGKNVRNKLFQQYRRREDVFNKALLEQAGEGAVIPEKGGMLAGKWAGPLSIDQDDVEYLLEVWRNRCAVTSDRLGNVMTITRWDDTRPGTCDNLVVMTANRLKIFDVDGKSTIPADVRARIEERLASCRIDRSA